MFRWIRGFFRMITGWFSGKADDLQSNVNVIRATYDAADAKGVARFENVKNAVATLMGIKEQRLTEIQGHNEKLDKLIKIQQGAANMAKKLTDSLKAQGKTADEIKVNPEFLRHMAAYQDASSNIAEIEKIVAEKEAEVEQRKKQIETYKIELQGMQKSIQKLRDEKSETIADVEVAKQTDAINSVLAGISKDSTDQDLLAVRQARQKAKARATISAELVGNDAKLAEDEYIKYAADTEHADKFAQLVGLDEGKVEESTLAPAKLPENN
jgi:hypothetical protein